MSYSGLPQWRPTKAGWPSRFMRPPGPARGYRSPPRFTPPASAGAPPRRQSRRPKFASHAARMRSEADNVASWLVEHAARRGERAALRDAERELSYAALEERCARAAGALASLGLGRGERVALLLGNRSATLEAVFAAARLGAIAVPLNTRLA